MANEIKRNPTAFRLLTLRHEHRAGQMRNTVPISSRLESTDVCHVDGRKRPLFPGNLACGKFVGRGFSKFWPLFHLELHIGHCMVEKPQFLDKMYKMLQSFVVLYPQ